MTRTDSHNVHLSSGLHLKGVVRRCRRGASSGATGTAVDVGPSVAVGAGCAVVFAGFGLSLWKSAVCAVPGGCAVPIGGSSEARRDCVEGNGVIEFPKRTASPKSGMLHTPQRFEGRGTCRVGAPSCYALRWIGDHRGAPAEAATKTRGPSGSLHMHRVAPVRGGRRRKSAVSDRLASTASHNGRRWSRRLTARRSVCIR